MREELAAVPGGHLHRAASLIDSDGVDPSRTFEVAVRRDGRRRRRSTSTSPAPRRSRPGAINSSSSQTLSGIIYAVRCFVDPDIPMNEGCFRPVHVHLPAGTLVNPTRRRRAAAGS